MLPLHGTASFLRGFHRTDLPVVLRLRDVQSGASDDLDVALIQDPNKLEDAIAGGFPGVIIVGDANIDELPRSNALPNVMVLPSRFGYLSDGDIIGLRGRDGRFRTLYRRKSVHNSFLITERCNHYCLMCSQPPRDINDGWILDEVKAALLLIERKRSHWVLPEESRCSTGEALSRCLRIVGISPKHCDPCPEQRSGIRGLRRRCRVDGCASSELNSRNSDLCSGRPRTRLCCASTGRLRRNRSRNPKAQR